MNFAPQLLAGRVKPVKFSNCTVAPYFRDAASAAWYSGFL